MSLAVIEASVRQHVTTRLASGLTMFAPAHVDAEVSSALRGLARGNRTVERDVPQALRHLAGFPVRRLPLAPLLGRM